MNHSPDRLYQLLPTVYRLRDAEQGYPLRGLLRVISEQVDGVESDIAQLYENWFIETCQDWVVPYIADLIGYQLVEEAGKPGDVTTTEGRQLNKRLIPRREVANTIRYRRRKGTLALLELLARDVADWPARAVEFYKLLGWNQHLNHLRPLQGQTVDLRQGDALARLDSPFDRLAHRVEVRRITSQYDAGRYNLPSVGVFVWRLNVYSVTRTPAYCLEAVGAHCYTFSILGNDTPLYTRPQPEPEPTHIAEELNLPIPIRRYAFEERQIEAGVERTQASTQYYGKDKSLAIWAGNWAGNDAAQPIPPTSIIPADLSDWQYRPRPGQIAVDPELGRIIFPPGQLPKEGVWVYYHYAFSADVGGGEYDRSLLNPAQDHLLDTKDLKDAAGLMVKLKEGSSPLSQYLRSQLSATTQRHFNDYTSADSPSRELVAAVIGDINRLISVQSLYDEQRFASIELTERIRHLLLSHPEGKDLIQLNRRLLATAYPEEIAKHYVLYKVGQDADYPYHRITEALSQWQTDQPRHGVIEIADSGVYVEQLNIELESDQTLQLRAANRKRPVIRLLNWYTALPDALSITLNSGSSLTIDGLLITGRGVRIESDQTPDGDHPIIMPRQGKVTIRHSTLVPGWELNSNCEPQRPTEPSLELFDIDTRLIIDRSIIGSIQVNQNEVKTDPIPIHISDSILDATSPDQEALGAAGYPFAHGRLTLRNSTVFGYIQVHAIDLAENSIFYGKITVVRDQQGCLRFCYVTPGSRTPRRYRCQPDLVEKAIAQQLPETATQAELAAARERERDRVQPRFNSTHYGRPTYCQLAEACAEEIKRGADDESEMGVFHHLYQPQRTANLRDRLNEYAPAGMEIGIIYAS